MRHALAFLLCFFGCSTSFYSGELPEGYRCHEDSADACPPGQVCDVPNGCCRRPGSSCGTPTASSPDLSSTPDLAEPFGCAGRGVQIGPGLYGCEGPFSQGQAAKLCAPGYGLTDSVLSPIEFAACAKTTSFYLSASLLYHSAPMVTSPVQCKVTYKDTITCVPPSPVTFRFRLGCGGFRFNGYLECYKACGALYQVASCYPPTPIDCRGSDVPGTLEDTTTNPNIGVLCRRR